MAVKKHGRNKEFCKSYASSGKREKNKVAKLVQTLKKQPTNTMAVAALKRLGAEKEYDKYNAIAMKILKERSQAA